MYPILIRLADRGWLETKWETNASEGRPPRHLYRLTAEGVAGASELEQAGKGNRRGRVARLRPLAGGAS